MSIVWTDTVTPLNAANMNALEQIARKGAANGYASLDGTTKVPVAQLPTIPLAGITPGANGQWLKTAGGVPVWSAITAADLPPQAVPGYGTTLPASPADGQEHILVDSITNPTYQWHFRYNAGSSSAYKWEFIGGPPGEADVSAVNSTASATYVDLGGPSLTIPRPGDYRVSWGCQVANQAAGAGNAIMGLFKNGADVGQNCSANFLMHNGTGYVFSAIKQMILTGGTLSNPGDVLQTRYQVSNALSCGFSSRFLTAIPVRVS